MKQRTLLFTIILSAIMALGASAAMAAVWTDKEDYSPGETVTISGDNSNDAGYLPGETVVVEVDGPNAYHATCESTADGDGAWSCQVVLNDDESAFGEYSYTATGQASGVSESGTFTDFNFQRMRINAQAGVSDDQAAYSGSLDVEVTLDVVQTAPLATQMRFKNFAGNNINGSQSLDNVCSSTSSTGFSAWEAFSTTKDWTLDGAVGPGPRYVCAQVAAGTLGSPTNVVGRCEAITVDTDDTTRFFDTFEQCNNQAIVTVRGWVETEATAAPCTTSSSPPLNEFALLNRECAIEQKNISTAGLVDIQLSYRREPQTGTSGPLVVCWKPSADPPASYTCVNDTGAGVGFPLNTLDLAAGAEDTAIDIRFAYGVGTGNWKVDDVKVTGTPGACRDHTTGEPLRWCGQEDVITEPEPTPTTAPAPLAPVRRR